MFLWKNNLKSEKIHSINSILLIIRELDHKRIEYDDFEMEYNTSSNKETYIKQKFDKIYVGKTNKSETIANKYKFALFLNHIINFEDFNQKLKYHKPCFQRINDLHEIIGEYILDLPIQFNWFIGTHGTSNIESLTKWFEFEKTCDDKNFKALVLPYPKVDFTNLPDRIEALKDKIEDITRNHDQSYYHQEVIKRINDLGFNNSRSINTQMNINDKIIACIYNRLKSLLNILKELFIISKKIDDHMCYPQNTIDYLFMVLIPKTAMRLIMEDIKCGFDKARKIMEESVAEINSFNSSIFGHREGSASQQRLIICEINSGVWFGNSGLKPLQILIFKL
ncbi:16097_t:CDS:2 [Gigaspora margarita]|uniref:Restriction of telomere capping protein 4 n=1 Tax=Gigaspora margarita TaxID=4874 RepID=A0ABN7V5R2_GIGMA|nr:16097_t:CDS:2 [Gigaspora margarita]